MIKRINRTSTWDNLHLTFRARHRKQAVAHFGRSLWVGISHTLAAQFSPTGEANKGLCKENVVKQKAVTRDEQELRRSLKATQVYIDAPGAGYRVGKIKLPVANHRSQQQSDLSVSLRNTIKLPRWRSTVHR